MADIFLGQNAFLSMIVRTPYVVVPGVERKCKIETKVTYGIC